MWRNDVGDVKSYYRNRVIAAKEDYFKSLATNMHAPTNMFKLGNNSKHNVPCKIKTNDVSICPQRYGAKTKEAKTPRYKEALSITRDENVFTCNAINEAYSK